MYTGLRTFALLDHLFFKPGPVVGQLRRVLAVVWGVLLSSHSVA
jgi:hypothetical protein